MTSSAPAQLTADDLVAQLGDAYGRFDADARALHLDLLNRIESSGDVAVDARLSGDGATTLVVSAGDAIGTLSLIAGLCMAHGIDIVAADAFTLRLPADPPQPVRRRPDGRPLRVAPAPTAPRRRVLDVFEVGTPPDAAAELWPDFTHDLERLFALAAAGAAVEARDQLLDRVSEALRATGSDEKPLSPVRIDIDNEAAAAATVLRIAAVDATGFLFEFTNALALLDVNIERAEVRTVAGETRDTFWVTEPSGTMITAPWRIEQLRTAAALIKQFTLLLPRSPNPAQALRQFSALAKQVLTRDDAPAASRSLESGTVLRTLADLMGVSEFLWEDFLRLQHENLFPVLRDVPSLDQERTAAELAALLSADLEGSIDIEARRAALNRFKDREMFRIDLRHITGRIAFEAFAEELSTLADVVVEGAMAVAYDAVSSRHGQPRTAEGQSCDWVAGALGKFGGRELGFASDVELLFVYEADGTTDGPTPTSNAEFFDACVREFLATIVTRQEGIFEVDLRLRPHGNAGPLAISEAGFRRYYAADGDARQFERMALVKLRPVGGSTALAARVIEARDAYVYSGLPIDLEDVRHLRGRQRDELVPAGEVSAKYSTGGVVDIEYSVQLRQIEAGASDPSVRVTGTRRALERLVAGGYLDAPTADRLSEAYSFLRRLIDGLRVVRGHARDLTLPPRDSQAFTYLARRMRDETPEALSAAIEAHMSVARGAWDSFEDPS